MIARLLHWLDAATVPLWTVLVCIVEWFALTLYRLRRARGRAGRLS